VRLVSTAEIYACRQGGYNMGQEAIPWIMLAATFSAAGAAVFTWLTARATNKATIASNLINCLNAYTVLMRARTKAEEARSEKLCKDFYRELFDLHWTEFQIWRDGMIPDHVMNAWLAVRRRNYAKDALEFETATGQGATVTYQQVWNALKDAEYFEPTDPFVRFMDKAHSEAITDMKKLRKEFKRR